MGETASEAPRSSGDQASTIQQAFEIVRAKFPDAAKAAASEHDLAVALSIILVHCIEQLSGSLREGRKRQSLELGAPEITPGQAHLLLAIYGAPRLLRDLKFADHKQSQSIHNHLRHLTRAGFLERRRSAADRRVMHLELSVKGCAFCAASLDSDGSRMGQRLADHLPLDDLLASHRVLRRLNRIVANI